MKKKLHTPALWIICIILCSACSSKAVPQWKSDAFGSLEKYKQSFLSGEDQKAENYFSKAVTEIRKSGDLDILAKACLTKCALNTAVLDYSPCSEFITLDKIEPVERHRAYHSFIAADLQQVNPDILPCRYKGFLTAMQEEKIEKINHEIDAIQDSLSRLIAAGIAVRKGIFNEQTLKTAVETASREGWQKPLLVYLAKLKILYETQGSTVNAHYIQQKIDIIQQSDQQNRKKKR